MVAIELGRGLLDWQMSAPVCQPWRDRWGETKVESRMKQDERTVVRKRTQQLVYLELGRDNGGVMLNLSEEGCGFQAISPVKAGKTRFAFQISGGRRIAGDAKIEWVDETGIAGGLQFISLSAEAREQIRRWLEETNAPEEPGEGVVPAAAAPLDAVAQGLRATTSREASAGSTSPSSVRRNSSPGTGVHVVEEVPLASPWTHIPVGNLPVLEDERARFPLLRGDASFGASRARSLALWRSLTVIATLVAIAALSVFYQREVGDSLIWMGETLTGKSKSSAAVPESKPAEPANPSAGVNAAAEKTESDATPKQELDATPKKEPEVTRGEELGPAKADAVIRGPERPESVLEQQPAGQKVDLPRSESESVESLWGAVQSGSVAAEMSLAERFVRGDGVTKNCDQARVLLKAAANKGNREARLRLYQLESGGCR
jgi:hypothetical protein